jgi:ABC-type branched-subunit amino acid transport system substrate-binding protein
LLPGGTSYLAEVDDLVSRAPDAVVLLGYPSSSARFVYELSLAGYSGVRRWYLSPTLKSEVFLETIPPGALDGMIGVAQGVPEGADFAQAFRARWGEEPMTAAHANFDALLILALAMESANQQLNRLPTSDELTEHIHRVSQPPGIPVRWDEYDRAAALVRAGEDIDLEGASGSLDFNSMNQVMHGLLRFWTVDGRRIVDAGYYSPECL